LLLLSLAFNGIVNWRQTLRAIADGADVRGFYYWTLVDNFEVCVTALIALCDSTMSRMTRIPTVTGTLVTGTIVIAWWWMISLIA
jgi:hypothetical protein